MERDREWLMPAIGIAIATLLCATALSFYTGYPGRPGSLTGLRVAALVMSLTALTRLLRYLFALWKSGETHPLLRIRQSWRTAAMGLVPIAAGILILTVFLHSITFLKSMIPAVVPFWADAPFAAIDRMFGIDPQALAISFEHTLAAIGIFYGLWHAVNLGGILWVIHWSRGDKGRHIISYMLTWLIGMTFAYLFSSAGPIFTGLYDPSVAPASVQKAAGFLWTNYEAQGARLGGGISAFPSMHVAIAAWFALALKDRGQAVLGILYLLAVLFCSVILGWHYVADGVAGIAIAIVSYHLASRWMAQRGQRAPVITCPVPASS